jgi:rhodanese-related sulfurtransferase
MFSFFRGAKSNPSADTVSHEDLEKARQDGSCMIIDVREPGEFAQGHVPGAHNFPLSRFRAQDVPLDRPIILICQAGGRSARALDACKAAGLVDVRHYKAGTGGYIARGGAVER